MKRDNQPLPTESDPRQESELPNRIESGDPSVPTPGGDVETLRTVDTTAGGADSSPLETVPSGEKAAAARKLQEQQR